MLAIPQPPNPQQRRRRAEPVLARQHDWIQFFKSPLRTGQFPPRVLTAARLQMLIC